jgi:hypothetical protein
MIKFKRPKKACRYNNDTPSLGDILVPSLGDIFSEVSKQAFSFNVNMKWPGSI